LIFNTGPTAVVSGIFHAIEKPCVGSGVLKLADGFYDVAISNIPFGDYKPYDARFKSWNFLIHDYFFAAALPKVRAGGLILFITSRGTLDKVDGALREYVAQQADLLGAIRLPIRSHSTVMWLRSAS
jgi:adenine-specific DNA methylase